MLYLPRIFGVNEGSEDTSESRKLAVKIGCETQHRILIWQMRQTCVKLYFVLRNKEGV